jgi:ribosomal-protein-alanine N-acetyltransferase
VTSLPDAESLSVRPAEQADLLAVHRIERESFEQPWPFDAFKRYLDEPGFLIAVDPTATSPGPLDEAPIVGFVVGAVVSTHGRTFGHIKDLAVHPDQRRKGTARTLLAAALDRLESRGAQTVKLEVRVSNHGARQLYRNAGFEPLRRVQQYYDDGEDALVMVRKLAE